MNVAREKEINQATDGDVRRVTGTWLKWSREILVPAAAVVTAVSTILQMIVR